MAEATNPITTASNPRVGDAFMAGVRWHVARPLASEESAFRAAQEFASAPSPEAGAGGDLGELERLSAAAAKLIAKWDGAPELPEEMEQALSQFEDAWAWADEFLSNRSGKLVASTGSGEETKGASFGPGSCPSGPTASRSSGFAAALPSRGWSFDMDAAPRDGTKVDLMYPEPRGRAINCLWYGDLGFGWIWRTPKWQLGQIEPLPESEWDIHCYPNMEPYAWRLPDEPGALAGEAEGRDRQGSVHDHAAPQGATP